MVIVRTLKFALIMLAAVVLVLSGTAIAAEKSKWPPDARDMSSFDKRTGDQLRRVYFVNESLDGISLEVPAPHEHVRSGLEQLTARSGRKYPELYLRLAHACLNVGDEAAAEKAIERYVSLSRENEESLKAEATFYSYRLKPKKELEAREKLANKLSGKKPLNPEDVHVAYISMVNIARKHNFPEKDIYRYFDLLEKALPDNFNAFDERLTALVNDKKYEEARKMARDLLKKFPENKKYLLRILAETNISQNKPVEALKVYANIQPADPPEIYSDYLYFLRATGKLADRKKELKNKLRFEEFDPVSAGELFNLYLDAEAEKANQLVNKWAKREKLSNEEIEILGELYMRAGRISEASRYYYSIYLSAPDDEEKQKALERLFLALMNYSARPFTGKKLSAYLSSGRFDSGVSTLGGVLSLILNTQGITNRFRNLEAAHSVYEARREAKKVLTEMYKVFPKSPRLADMKAKFTLSLINNAQYDEAIVSAREFIKNHPNHSSYFAIYMLIPRAYAAKKDHTNEWKAYEDLLSAAALMKNTGEYHRALNAYIGSLTANKQLNKVLGLYKREIKTHPDDEELYERLLDYTSKHDLYEEERKVYETAIDSFKTTKWYHRLARWYLRRKGKDSLNTVTDRIKDKMGPDELSRYISEFVHFTWNNRADANSKLYLATHLYAHKRFPDNMNFLRGLLHFYEHFNKRDGEYKEEIRQLTTKYFLHSKEIRIRYLSFLGKNKMLEDMLSDMSKKQEPTLAERTFLAWGYRWISEYEIAGKYFEKLYELYPGDKEIANELAGLNRSLSKNLYGQELKHLTRSAEVYAALGKRHPAESSYPTLEGEVWIDAGNLEKAKAAWEKIIPIEPGVKSRYLEVASIYWDYYLFDDSKQTLLKARKVFNDPVLYADKVAAILESAGKHDEAVTEYIQASVVDRHGSYSLRRRLAWLANRKNMKASIIAKYSAAVEASPTAQAVMSYSDFLALINEKKLRTDLLSGKVETIADTGFLNEAAEIFASLGETGLEEKALGRLAAINPNDMQYLERLAGFHERTKQYDKARVTFEKMVDLLVKDDENAQAVNMLVKWSLFEARIGNKISSVELIARAAKTARGPKREGLRFSLAQKYLEQEKFDDAKATLKVLIKEHPLIPEYFNLYAQVLTKTNDLDGLVKLYKDAIKSFKAAPLERDLKREKLKSLRIGLAESYTKLKMYTEAQDNLIEAINLEPTDDYTVRKAYSFSKEYNLQDRLLKYYEKTAAKSYKNYRWQIVLATFHMEERRLSAAAKAYSKAIEIEPQRLDFYSSLADVYLMQGNYAAARGIYEELARLGTNKEHWWSKIADMYARSGQYDKALEYAKSMVEEDPPDYGPYFRLAYILDRWGRSDDAAKYLEKGIEKYSANPLRVSIAYYDMKLYCNIMTKAGRGDDAFFQILKLRTMLQEKLDKTHKSKVLENNILKSGLYSLKQGLEIHLPTALFEHASPAQILRVKETVVELSKKLKSGDEMESALLGLSKMIREPELEKTVQINILNNTPKSGKSPYYDKHGRYLTELEKFFGKRRMFGDLVALLSGYNHHSTYSKKAMVTRIMGDEKAEFDALKQWYEKSGSSYTGTTFKSIPEAVREYYRLVWDMELENEKEKLAKTKNSYAGYYLAYLVQQGELELALKTLNHVYSSHNNAWKKTMTALIFETLDKRPKEAEELFKQVLWVKPAGEKLGKYPPSGEVYSSTQWDSLAIHFGKFLLKNGDDKEAMKYIPAYIETRPRSTDAYREIGQMMLDMGEPKIAREFYFKAWGISDKNPETLAWLAASTWMSGDKNEAEKLWGKLVESGNQEDYMLFFETAKYAGASKLADEKTLKILTDMYLKGHAYIDLLVTVHTDFMERGKEEDFVSLMKKMADKKPKDTYLPEYLLDAYLIPDEERPYFYEMAIMRVKALDSQHQDHLNELRTAYLDTLIELKEIDRAFVLIEELEALDIFTRQSGHEWRAKALIVAGKVDEAMPHLWSLIEASDHSRSSYNQAQWLLSSLGYADEAEEFKKAMLERAVRDKTASGLEMITLARILVQDDEIERAKSLIERATVLRPDDIASLDAAAQVYEEIGEWGKALEKRKMIFAIQPANCANSIEMQADTAKLGKPEDALLALKGLLAVNVCKKSEFARLPAVYAEIVEADKKLMNRELEFLNKTTSKTPVEREEYFLVLAKISKPNTALVVLENYAANGTYPLASLMEIARLTEKKGDRKKLISALEKVHMLNPIDYGINIRLAREYYEDGKYRRAVDISRTDQYDYSFSFNLTPNYYNNLTFMKSYLSKTMKDQEERFEYVTMIANAALKAGEPEAAAKYAEVLKDIATNNKQKKSAEKIIKDMNRKAEEYREPKKRGEVLAEGW